MPPEVLFTSGPDKTCLSNEFVCLDDGSRSSRSTMVEASYIQKTDSKSPTSLSFSFKIKLCY